MKIVWRLALSASLFSILSAIALDGVMPGSAALQTVTIKREDAYRANNLGVALLEQYKYKEGAESFSRALQLDPKVQIARINLSIALFNIPDLPGAQREAGKAIAESSKYPHPYYILGLIAKSQNRVDEAIRAFQHVLQLDPRDVGASVQLGQLYAGARNYADAIKAFRVAVEVDPYNMTALYNLGLALTRSNQRAEGQQAIQKFQELRQRGTGTTIGQNYLEQGRYSEAIASTGAEPELIDRAVPAVTFAEAPSLLPSKKPPRSSVFPSPLGQTFKTAELAQTETNEDLVAGLGGFATLVDYDGDGDLDLLRGSGNELSLYRNDAGRLVEVTSESGALAMKLKGIATAGVAGDYDNDGKPDLFVVHERGGALYHNDGNGKFSDNTIAAGIPAYPYLSAAVAFADVDHDGDVDIFIAGLADLAKTAKAGGTATLRFPEDFASAPNMLLRNDGNVKFTDITASAKLAGAGGHAIAVVPTDFDNHRDIDLLVVNYDRAPELYSNQRDGSFRKVDREVGLEGAVHCTSVAAGDVNKDGFTDFFFASDEGPGSFAISDGQGKFKSEPAPAGSGIATGTQFLDYDNDGLLDCVMLTSSGLRVWRNLGDDWMNTSARAVAPEFGSSSADRVVSLNRVFASGDLDNDGDTDLLLASPMGDLKLARNDGGNSNHSLRVNLLGRVSNRSGIGAKIEVRAGSLGQKLESYSASPAPAPFDILFGLGNRSTADAVRVLWPAGIVQAELESPRASDPRKTTATLSVTELDKKPSSCPYLYTWNGERFEFITDFMGGGEMGYWEAPGHYNTPDPDEYVRIPASKLKPKDGRYELRVTNELEEVLYVDRLQLIAVDHPRGVEIYPNEGMTTPPRSFKLYKTKNAKPPISAVDDRGNDVLSRIATLDRSYPDSFQLDSIRGYAGVHTLTLKLDGAKDGRALLLLTGWTDYAFSSDNVAASHSGKESKLPALQVKDSGGRWRTVIEDIGIPVGRPQTVTVDLTGKFLSSSREVRIVTSLRIYWDQILVDTSRGNAPTQITRLDPVTADLRWRGYSREATPDGREPFGYDYEQVSYASPWKVFPGRYTRFGDVRSLLQATDDIFVISRTGDEISLSFDANRLPELPAGWTRTFLLYSDGFSKEMDINSASPDQVTPLPFHGMTRYPYDAPEAYPMTAARRAYHEEFNTRIVRAAVPVLVTSNR